MFNIFTEILLIFTEAYIMDKRLKIAFFNDVFYPMVDGVVIVIDNYAKRLAKFADVTLFCPKPIEKSYDDSKYNFKVERCRRMKFFSYEYPIATIPFDPSFRKKINAQNFDIVHVHDPFFVARYGIKYAKKNNIPVVGTIHSQLKRDFYKATKSQFLTERLTRYIMKAYNSCDECWAVNEKIKEVYVRDYKLTAPGIVMNNATDMLPVDPYEAFKTINENYGISPDEKVLVFLGRINEIKNIFLIADSLKYIKNAGIPFKMVFIGKGPDENRLKALVSENGLNNNVIFTGRLTDRHLIAQFLSRADLFLFPSVYDTSSLVQIEAASQHTPSIFIRGSVTSFTATENVDCFMSEETPEDFANCIIRALGNEELLKKTGDKAFENLYVTWDAAVEKTYKRYLELIEAKKSAK